MAKKKKTAQRKPPSRVSRKTSGRASGSAQGAAKTVLQAPGAAAAKRKTLKTFPAQAREEISDHRPAGREDLIPIVGVGASAGGLEAFTQLLAGLPADTGMAFVLVSHLSHQHKSMLTELLSRSTPMLVTQVMKPAKLEPNHVYVIPPNRDLVISDGYIKSKAIADPQRPHMAIDYFFRSLAANRGSRAIAVVLSGTGTDGTLGLAAIKAEGGVTFVQDEKSARYPDMPRSAGRGATAADFVLPPEGISAELTRIARHPYVNEARIARVPEPSGQREDEIGKIFTLVRGVTGIDFSHYKPATIKRRISRRMLLHRIESLAQYVKHLRANPEEVESLYHDLLINVTGFFRDPDTFDVLRKKILPKILKNRPPDAPVRVWTPGCATGEETYSIAISLLEALESLGSSPPLQIFGTDVSPVAIRKARDGVYPHNIAMDVSPQRLRRFFVKTADGYQISKGARDLCVFAPQNICKDPPFSRLDLISCRNVLIYLGPALQQRVLATFHYALKPAGFLLLGTSETAGASSELFDVADKKHKIYSKRQTAGQPHFEFVGRDLEIANRLAAKSIPSQARAAADLTSETDRLILSKYTPAGVVINEALDIIQFRGQTSAFLEPAQGEASLSLPKMVRQGLLMDLRAAIHQARHTRHAVRKENLRVRLNGGIRQVSLEVVPLTTAKLPEDYYLVLFEQKAAPDSPPPVPAGRSRKGDARLKAAEHETAALREELASTQADLHAIIEEQEAGNEELQSANEEVLSSNEELQSTNEELETAKEELQATNEELTTVNEEMQNRNAELSLLNNDLVNLIGSVDIGILMLGTDLRIRRFTPAAQRVMNLIPGDVGRPLSDIKSNLHHLSLEDMINEVIDTMNAKELEVQDHLGRWYSMRIRPYKTLDNKIDGAVVVLVDINDLKRAFVKLGLLSRLFMVGVDPVLIHDIEGRILQVNDEVERIYGWSRAELLRKSITVLVPPDHHEATQQYWEQCRQGSLLTNIPAVHWNKARQRMRVQLTLTLLTDEHDAPVAIATMAQHVDRTRQVNAAIGCGS